LFVKTVKSAEFTCFCFVQNLFVLAFYKILFLTFSVHCCLVVAVYWLQAVVLVVLMWDSGDGADLLANVKFLDQLMKILESICLTVVLLHTLSQR